MLYYKIYALIMYVLFWFVFYQMLYVTFFCFPVNHPTCVAENRDGEDDAGDGTSEALSHPRHRDCKQA